MHLVIHFVLAIIARKEMTPNNLSTHPDLNRNEEARSISARDRIENFGVHRRH